MLLFCSNQKYKPPVRYGCLSEYILQIRCRMLDSPLFCQDLGEVFRKKIRSGLVQFWRSYAQPATLTKPEPVSRTVIASTANSVRVMPVFFPHGPAGFFSTSSKNHRTEGRSETSFPVSHIGSRTPIRRAKAMNPSSRPGCFAPAGPSQIARPSSSMNMLSSDGQGRRLPILAKSESLTGLKSKSLVPIR